jgi:hypothetical protein
MSNKQKVQTEDSTIELRTDDHVSTTCMGDIRTPEQRQAIKQILDQMADCLHEWFAGKVEDNILEAIYDLGDTLIEDISKHPRTFQF